MSFLTTTGQPSKPTGGGHEFVEVQYWDEYEEFENSISLNLKLTLKLMYVSNHHENVA